MSWLGAERRRNPQGRARLFSQSLVAQRRIIAALLIREIYTRFGRENIGFAWIVAEPLTFALPVLGMWSLIRAHTERGIPMLGMAWTGYLPIMLFRHMGGRMLFFVRQNAGLLYHRQVTIFDLFAARALLEILSTYSAVVVSGAILMLFGAIEWPVDPPMFYIGYFYMTWWCVAVGLIVGGCSERSEITEKVWGTLSYMYLMVSGFFFLASWLPNWVRNIALTFMPALPCYEMIRAGLFGHRIHAYYNIPYLSVVLSVLTLIGLHLIQTARKHLVLE